MTAMWDAFLDWLADRLINLFTFIATSLGGEET